MTLNQMSRSDSLFGLAFPPPEWTRSSDSPDTCFTDEENSGDTWSELTLREGVHPKDLYRLGKAAATVVIEIPIGRCYYSARSRLREEREEDGWVRSFVRGTSQKGIDRALFVNSSWSSRKSHVHRIESEFTWQRDAGAFVVEKALTEALDQVILQLELPHDKQQELRRLMLGRLRRPQAGSNAQLLEVLDGYVDTVVDDTAYVRLRRADGELIDGEYAVGELAAQGIGPTNSFEVRVYRTSKGVNVELSPKSRRQLTGEEIQAIWSEVERDLGG